MNNYLIVILIVILAFINFGVLSLNLNINEDAQTKQSTALTTTTTRTRFTRQTRRAVIRDNNNRPFSVQNLVKRFFTRDNGGCLTQQNTTSVIYFSAPNSGINFQARINRFTNIEELRELLESFNPKNPTYFIIHGWNGCNLSKDDYSIKIKDLILNKRKTNIFIVDWSHRAHNIAYERSVIDMTETANDLNELIKNLQLAFPGFNTNNINLIGFSLGAHVAGQLGKSFNGQINQILGLDPAGVSISDLHPKFKLTRDDAKYVIAHHTEINFFGTKANLANHDVFINGGADQPICSDATGLFKNSCNHRAAHRFYSTPIFGKCMMMAYRCFNWDTFQNGECGFCKTSPNDCLSTSNDFQYINNNDYDKLIKKSQVSSTKRSPMIDIPWTLNQNDRRFYLKTSGDEQKFCYNFSQSKLEQWSMSVKFERNNFEFPLIQMNKLKLNSNLTVYEDKSNLKSISGSNIFVTLLTVDSQEQIYNSMPLKVNQVIMNLSKKDPQVEVYMNYMSHISYDVRRDKSGKVNNIVWNLVENLPLIGGTINNNSQDRSFRRRRFKN